MAHPALTPPGVHPDRVHVLRDGAPHAQGPVVYWMQRSQRTRANPALAHARALAAAGVALRRREAAGGTLAALKTLGTVVGALHVRDEVEVPMEGEDWPVPVARRLAEHVALWQLRPRVEVATERTTYRVVFEGRPVALLAFDEVRARLPGGEREALFAEAELEALGDVDEGVLVGAAEVVERLVRLTPSAVTKLQRAEALLVLGAAF
ncbi:MAG: CYTH domain-containing protein [Trueperaceae bacterium]